MIDLPHIKTIQKKWIERRVISHLEIGELLDAYFQLHNSFEQLQKENAQYKALSAALPDVVQLEIK